jgi:hypothetical protein
MVIGSAHSVHFICSRQEECGDIAQLLRAGLQCHLCQFSGRTDILRAILWVSVKLHGCMLNHYPLHQPNESGAKAGEQASTADCKHPNQ